MLTNLSIKNYALIENLTVDFKDKTLKGSAEHGLVRKTSGCNAVVSQARLCDCVSSVCTMQPSP